MKRYKTYLALEVTPSTLPEFTVARVRETRKCPICGYTWAVTQRLPDSIGWQFDVPFEMLIIRPGESRSGAHRVELLTDVGFLPTGLPREFVALGSFRLLPAKFALTEKPIAVFNLNYPFAHDVAVLGTITPDAFPHLPHTRICGRCVRQRLREQPDYVQGRLFIRKERRWVFQRAGVSVHQTAAEEIEVQFFNHNIKFTHGLLYVRRDMASLYLFAVGRAYISSPDHPGQDIVLTGPGEYNLFHPAPRRGAVD
mgnify:CR=1 FL=1